jgi:hypothetical protein
MPTDQLPPADELFDVRDKIRNFKQREAELRALMLSDPSARTGNLYAAEIKDIATARLDIKEMKANHPSIVEQFTHTVFDKRVELRGINEDGELTSLRRKPEKATP